METFEAHHVPFFELLALQTNELSPNRVRWIQAHIEQCPACRMAYVDVCAARAEFLQQHPPEQTIDALLRSSGACVQPPTTVAFSTRPLDDTTRVVDVRIQPGASRYAGIWTVDVDGAVRVHRQFGVRRTRTFSTGVAIDPDERVVVLAFVGPRPLEHEAIAEWIACELEFADGNPAGIPRAGLVGEDVLARSAVIPASTDALDAYRRL